MSKLTEKLTELLEKRYRWPTKKDRLLRDSEDWRSGVEFAQSEISRHVHIWSGYMRAGEVLIEACQRDQHERHSLIYPILFNYRQGIELAMKWIIARYGVYSSVKVGNIRHHNLWQLWKVCKQIIIEVGSDDESIYIVEQIIKDFHDLDKSALAFRYSRDKKGTLIALPDTVIDLGNSRCYEGCQSFFRRCGRATRRPLACGGLIMPYIPVLESLTVDHYA